MDNQSDIPEDIKEIMSYLSYTFSKSMKDPINSAEDLYQDLVILYLENATRKEVKDPSDKNQWFIYFKSRLTNKYNRLLKERDIISSLRKESS